jgi:hypothetical protein
MAVEKPPQRNHADWWTDERRREAGVRAKAWHARLRATDPHLIARAEAKANGWPFTALPHWQQNLKI